jgi:hypothetical protein
MKEELVEPKEEKKIELKEEKTEKKEVKMFSAFFK